MTVEMHPKIIFRMGHIEIGTTVVGDGDQITITAEGSDMILICNAVRESEWPDEFEVKENEQ